MKTIDPKTKWTPEPKNKKACILVVKVSFPYLTKREASNSREMFVDFFKEMSISKEHYKLNIVE